MKRIGIVGCGGISNVHAWALKQLGETVVAVCDIEKEKAQNLISKAGLNHAVIYTKFEKMLAENRLDVLHICTPHFLHVPMAVAALERGIHVFMEKPVSISREQLMLLEKEAKEANARIGFCLQNRYNETTKTLDRLVASGEYGVVLGGKASVTWRRDEDYYEGSPWKGKLLTEGGGALINQSIHTLDLLLRYLGTPDCVKASISNHHLTDFIEVEDTVEAWLSFEAGKRGLFYASNAYVTNSPVSLELELKKARITMMDKALVIAKDNELQVISCEEADGIGKGYWGNGHLSCIRDFYDCLESGRRFMNDFAGVQVTADTMLKIYECAKGRKHKTAECANVQHRKLKSTN